MTRRRVLNMRIAQTSCIFRCERQGRGIGLCIRTGRGSPQARGALLMRTSSARDDAAPRQLASLAGDENHRKDLPHGSIFRTVIMTCNFPAHLGRSSVQKFGYLTNR